VYQRLFKHVLFPFYERVVARRGTPTFQREYERSQWFDAARLERLQLEKLNALLDHAWREAPFLARFWRSAGVRHEPLERVADLERYPVLTKAHVTANYEDMIARSWRGKTLTKTTGGSSGTPFKLEYTMESYARRTAIMWRGYAWGGADLGTKTAYLWGTGQRTSGFGGLKDSLYHRAFNRRFLDAFSMTESNIGDYVRQIEEYAPDVLVGYVAPTVTVARHLVRQGKTLRGLESVITGAEALFEPERKVIEKAFGCKVFNTYGCREFMLLASECPEHSGLHANIDHVVLETVDPDGHRVRGVSGDVVVTDLHNYGMPFVRYQNGDRATWSDTKCACGRGLPLLASVDGRILETIRTSDGRHVPGEFFVYAMLEMLSIKQYLVVQTALDAIEVHVVKDGLVTDEERSKITAKMRTAVGDKCKLEVKQVDAISASKSGKRRVTVSLINAPPPP
jgi:phenylacetate-CoA ligase